MDGQKSPWVTVYIPHGRDLIRSDFFDFIAER